MPVHLKHRHEEGQDLVEFALVLPLLLILFLGIIEFSIVIFSYNSVANAAREGARYGIIHHAPEDMADIEAAARQSLTGLPAVIPEPVYDVAADTIRVEVIYNHELLTAPIIQAVGGDGTIVLRAVATMRTE